MPKPLKNNSKPKATESGKPAPGQTAVIDASSLLRAIVDSSFDAIIGKDLNGTITSWNGAAEKLFGYSAAEMIGTSILRLIPEGLHDDENVILAQIKRGDTIEHFDTVRLVKGGGTIDVSLTVSPIRNAGGEIVGASKVARDITYRKRAEAILLESEETFRTLANSIPQLAWTANADGRAYWFNQRWHDYTGTTAEDKSTWNRRAFHDPEVLPEILRRWQIAVDSGKPFEMEFPLRGVDGVFRAFLTRIQPLKDASGAVLRWFGTATDVSELKEMEESLRATQARLNSTLRAASVGTWTWDIPNNVLVADKFTSGIFSIEADLANAGLPVEAYFVALHEDDRETVAERLASAIAKCGDYDVEFRVRQSDGSYLWLLSRGRIEPGENGIAARFHGAVVDITEHKHAEELIHTLNVDLEKRVADRTAQLEEAISELEAFSYSVSHDLRAPLRVMNGYSHAVLEDYASLLPQEGIDYLHSIQRGVMKMDALITDLLSFSSTSRTELHKSKLATDELVATVITDLLENEQGRTIDVRIGELPECSADYPLLRQVWVNLISNAFKYTRKREFPTVEIGFEPSPEGTIFFIRDNGAGFDMRHAEKLFTVFHRLHGSRDFEGSGVGLAIVRRIVNRHGGKIWAEATENQGATFYFTLGT